jgi:hypothetical protein
MCKPTASPPTMEKCNSRNNTNNHILVEEDDYVGDNGGEEEEEDVELVGRSLGISINLSEKCSFTKKFT